MYSLRILDAATRDAYGLCGHDGNLNPF